MRERESEREREREKERGRERGRERNRESGMWWPILYSIGQYPIESIILYPVLFSPTLSIQVSFILSRLAIAHLASRKEHSPGATCRALKTPYRSLG